MKQESAEQKVVLRKTPLPYRMLAGAAFRAALHKSTGSVALSVLFPLLRRTLLLYPSYLPRQVRKDGFDIARALWASALRVGIPRRMADILHGIFTTGTSKGLAVGAPGFLTVSPCKTCNLRCPDCYADSALGEEALSYSTLSRIVSEAKELWRMRFIVISGGEPFVYRDQGRDILNLAEDNQECIFLVYTNGTLLDREFARRMADAGNITPAISVEGMDARTEARRGKGIFARVLSAMENLRDVGVPFGLSLTATRENADELLSDSFLDFFFREKGAAYAWLFHYMPIGRNPNLEAMPSPEQRVQLWRRSWQAIRERKFLIGDFWNHGTVSQGCIAGARAGGYFHIDWNGDVSPCVFFPYAGANINDLYREGKTLSDALSTPLFQSVRNWQRSYGFQQPALTSETDWLRPCPIRDHYEQTARFVRSSGGKPTDIAPRGALEDSAYLSSMVEFDLRLAEATGQIWDRKYINARPRQRQG